MPTADEKYPGLMAYIHDRNRMPRAADWCDQLHVDEADARKGGFADVASQLRIAQADYAKTSKAAGGSGYPYNRAMGEFLGLPIKDNGDPGAGSGYYMANSVMSHHSLGVARRDAERLIAEGRPLRLVAARTKGTRTPIRFTTFIGPEQIRIEGQSVVVSNGKKRGLLSSNYSVETCLERLVDALRSGNAYGQPAT